MLQVALVISWLSKSIPKPLKIWGFVPDSRSQQEKFQNYHRTYTIFLSFVKLFVKALWNRVSPFFKPTISEFCQKITQVTLLSMHCQVQGESSLKYLILLILVCVIADGKGRFEQGLKVSRFIKLIKIKNFVLLYQLSTKFKS